MNTPPERISDGPEFHIRIALGGAHFTNSDIAHQRLSELPHPSQNDAATERLMAEVFVVCPECGLRAKVTNSGQKIIGDERKCKHRQNPMNCPELTPALSTARQALQGSSEPH